LSASLVVALAAACGASTPSQPTPTSPSVCTFAVGSTPSDPVAAAGEEFTVTVSAPAGCSWSATSAVPFVTIAGAASGSGDGSVRLSVQANAGGEREGAVQIAGVSRTIRQHAAASAACVWSVAPAEVTIPAEGGDATFRVSVTSGTECSWTATTVDSFVVIRDPATGMGDGQVSFSARANDGAARTGTITIAGQTVTIHQTAAGAPPLPCLFTVTPADVTADANGQSTSILIAVTQGTACAWTAESNSAFLGISSASSGVGNGVTTVTVAANSGAARTGTVAIAGQTVTIHQNAAGTPPLPCLFAVAPTDIVADASGRVSAILVTVTQGTACAWTAQSNSAFLSISGASSGVGDGATAVTVAANSGAARTGTVAIAGQTVTVHQNAAAPPTVPCLFTITPADIVADANGQSTSIVVTVTQGTACAWTAQSNSAFLSISGASSGVGSGAATVTVAPNTGAARTGTLLIAGKTVTVQQGAAGPCVTSIVPATLAFPVAGGSGTVQVNAAGGCSWTLSTDASFITVPSGVHTGSAAVSISTSPNGGSATRYGHVSAGPYSLLVTQAGSVDPAAVLSYESDPGDYVGAGQSRTLVLRGAEFSATIDGSGGQLHFRMPPSGGTWWDLYLFAPTGQALTPGLYDLAERAAFHAPAQPGLDFGGSGRGCNKVTGRFLVNEAVFGPGNTVQRFHARFEQHCEGASAALRGQIWIDAQGSTTPPALSDFPGSPGGQTTILAFQSQPGDFVGAGTTQNFTLAGHIFSAWGSNSAPAVNIRLAPVGAGPSWMLDMSAPSGTKLQPGTYENATRYPFQAPGVPGLSFSGNGRGCNTLTGRFDVLEAVYGPQGEVRRFHATFEQHCEGAIPALLGEVWIIADPWR
jgi:hypothetical protein